LQQEAPAGKKDKIQKGPRKRPLGRNLKAKIGPPKKKIGSGRRWISHIEKLESGRQKVVCGITKETNRQWARTKGRRINGIGRKIGVRFSFPLHGAWKRNPGPCERGNPAEKREKTKRQRQSSPGGRDGRPERSRPAKLTLTSEKNWVCEHRTRKGRPAGNNGPSKRTEMISLRLERPP